MQSDSKNSSCEDRFNSELSVRYSKNAKIYPKYLCWLFSSWSLDFFGVVNTWEYIEFFKAKVKILSARLFL